MTNGRHTADGESGPAASDGGTRTGDRARLRKRSVRIAGHRTSVSLEDAFWDALRRIADRRGESVADIVARVDRERSGNLSSALRVFVLADLEAGPAVERAISKGS